MAWEFVSLEQGLEQAGSPVKLLWKPGAPAWKPPVVADEYVGWAEEQTAWRATASLADLSYHMSDAFIEGPDATRLLSETSANNLAKFEVGQAKQFVPVANDGNLITDGILTKTGERSYVLSGVEAAQHWVEYHAKIGNYDVEISIDPTRDFTPGDPKLFRLQVQGPNALDVVAKAFGAPIPETKFFHSAPVQLAGASFRALRHGMAGQAGYEFIGDYADHDRVKEALLAAGESFGIVHVGALAYSTNGVESGWVPSPTPAIYTDPGLDGLRRSINLYSYEGQKPLYGSHFSEDIADYYLSPWELGYGRSISLDHEFIGRDALQAAKETVRKTKVTLEFDADDVARLLGASGYLNTYPRHRIESAGRLVGFTQQVARIAPLNKVLALSLVDKDAAAPGTQVQVAWGQHPGPGTPADAHLEFPRIRATVQPAPYNEFARTSYRQD